MLRGANAAELTAATRGAPTKIRKRCAVSPSGASSSPDRQRRRALRLKRGVRLIGGHRRGGCTGTGASPRKQRRMSESSWNQHYHHGHADVETRSAASARKLVSALWQVDKGDGAFEEEEIGWDAAAARRSSDHRRSASLEFSKITRRNSKVMKDDAEQRSWHNGHAHGQWFSDVMSNGGGTVEVSFISFCQGF